MGNEICKKKTTAPDTSVGADDGQPLPNSTEISISAFEEAINGDFQNSTESLDELYRRMQRRLKAEIADLKQELSEYKSVRSRLRTSDMERENEDRRGKVQRYEDVSQHNHLWHFFRPRREKAVLWDDAR